MPDDQTITIECACGEYQSAPADLEFVVIRCSCGREFTIRPTSGSATKSPPG